MAKDIRQVRLANRVRVARAERQLSQEQLALLVGVTRQTISCIETGHYSPSTKLALELAYALGDTVDHLFYLVEGE